MRIWSFLFLRGEISNNGLTLISWKNLRLYHSLLVTFVGFTLLSTQPVKKVKGKLNDYVSIIRARPSHTNGSILTVIVLEHNQLYYLKDYVPTARKFSFFKFYQCFAPMAQA
jgi:hypothetical protein